MSLIHPLSCDCVKSELGIYSVPMTQTSVEHGRFMEHGPISSLEDGPIEFKISGLETEYINLMNTFVFGKVTAADCTNIANNAPVAPVNLLLHSLFSPVDMILGGTLVNASTNTQLCLQFIIFVDPR